MSDRAIRYTEWLPTVGGCCRCGFLLVGSGFATLVSVTVTVVLRPSSSYISVFFYPGRTILASAVVPTAAQSRSLSSG